MEVIQIPGYTHEEKLHIAVKYLVSKQVREHGLTELQIKIPEDSIRVISKCWSWRCRLLFDNCLIFVMDEWNNQG